MPVAVAMLGSFLIFLFFATMCYRAVVAFEELARAHSYQSKSIYDYLKYLESKSNNQE